MKVGCRLHNSFRNLKKVKVKINFLKRIESSHIVTVLLMNLNQMMKMISILTEEEVRLKTRNS